VRRLTATATRVERPHLPMTAAWTPDDYNWSQARHKGWSQARIVREIEALRQHHLALGTTSQHNFLYEWSDSLNTREGIEQWLEALLGEGPVPEEEVNAAAREHEYDVDYLGRARMKTGTETKQVSDDAGSRLLWFHRAQDPSRWGREHDPTAFW
jgi:hypothetical protein